jgi:hypothetical protein
MFRNKKLKKMSMTEDVISIGYDNHAWNWSNIEPKLQNPKRNLNVNGAGLRKQDSKY